MENIKKVILPILFAGLIMSSGTIKTEKTGFWSRLGLRVGTVATVFGAAFIFKGLVGNRKAFVEFEKHCKPISAEGSLMTDDSNKIKTEKGLIDNKNENINCGCKYDLTMEESRCCDSINDSYSKASNKLKFGYAFVGTGLLTLGAVYVKRYFSGIAKSYSQEGDI